MSDGGVRDRPLGWRLASALRSNPRFEVNLDVMRGKPVNDDGDDQGIMLRGSIRWQGAPVSGGAWAARALPLKRRPGCRPMHNGLQRPSI